MSEKKASPLNVLIIDSHVLVRQIVSHHLRNMKGISSIQSISSIEEKYILSDISRLQPDVIFLGIDKPDSKHMNILHIIREKFPLIPVFIMTPRNSTGALTALKGLKMGAVEFITKPDKNVGTMLATWHFQKRIVPVMGIIRDLNMKILLKNNASEHTIPEVSKISEKKHHKSTPMVKLIVIAGSTGGIRALYDLVPTLSEKIPVPIIIIQHMPKIYTRELADDLDRITQLNVREAQNDSPLITGQIYLAPGGYHTVVKYDGMRKMICIHRGPREQKNRPSIDVLLRSSVQVYNNKVLGVFLSGWGKDGHAGADYIFDAGGKVLLQDNESSLLGILPGFIAKQHPTLKQVHVDNLGAEILKQCIGTPSLKSYRHSEKPSAQ